jgi:hypothetical protein
VELGNWIASKRAYLKCPVIDNPMMYAKSWLMWWMSIQPQWQKGPGPLPLPIYSSDGAGWGVLQSSGENGFLSVIMSLLWWGQADHGKEWNMVLLDISWCLEHMSASEKQVANVSGEEPAAKR